MLNCKLLKLKIASVTSVTPIVTTGATIRLSAVPLLKTKVQSLYLLMKWPYLEVLAGAATLVLTAPGPGLSTTPRDPLVCPAAG